MDALHTAFADTQESRHAGNLEGTAASWVQHSAQIHGHAGMSSVVRLAFWGTRRVMQATMGFSGDMLRPKPICKYLHVHCRVDGTGTSSMCLGEAHPASASPPVRHNMEWEGKPHLLQSVLPSRRSGVKGEGINGSHAGSHNAVSMPFRTPCTWQHPLSIKRITHPLSIKSIKKRFCIQHADKGGKVHPASSIITISASKR